MIRIFREVRDDTVVVGAVLLTRRAIAELDAVALRSGGLTVDPLAYEVWLDGRRVPMTGRELEVLVYLMRHADRPVPGAELQEALWGRDGHGLIRTVRRQGYRFRPGAAEAPGRTSATPGPG